MLKVVKTSVIGPGHICDDLPNQDAIGHFITDKYWAIVVCDGMGSRPHADIGSQTATLSIKTILKRTAFNTPSKTVITDFYQHWLNAIKQHSIRPRDAVTTVMIAWGNHKGSFRYFQLGDGVICTQRNIHTNISTDEFSNVTTGMGLSRKYSDWNVGRGDTSKSDNAVFLMTDGISEDITDHCAFSEALVKFSKNKSPRRIKKHLKNMFTHWPTPYHTDDKSLAMVIIDEKK